MGFVSSNKSSRRCVEVSAVTMRGALTGQHAEDAGHREVSTRHANRVTGIGNMTNNSETSKVLVVSEPVSILSFHE